MHPTLIQWEDLLNHRLHRLRLCSPSRRDDAMKVSLCCHRGLDKRQLLK